MEFLASLVAVAVALAPAGRAVQPVQVPGSPSCAFPTCALPADDWIVEEADNVCGLTDPRQITNPAVIDYDELLEATSEMKEMKRKGIDKDSPEGQVLYNKAVDRVQRAASKVMKDKGYDSVWKKIKHRQGRTAPGITDSVKAQLDQSVEAP